MKTYIINLPHRIDRLSTVTKNPIPQPKLVRAVHYSKLPNEDKQFWINKLVTKENFIDSDGAMGCFASHYNTWKMIIESEEEIALVLEDDVKFKPAFETTLKTITESTPEDFDILFIGGTYEGGLTTNGIYKPEFAKKNAFTTEAYIISKTGAAKLIELVDNKKSTSCNVDWYLHNVGKKNLINYYSYYPLICFQTHGDSDIK